jgi:hypothetical protein
MILALYVVFQCNTTEDMSPFPCNSLTFKAMIILVKRNDLGKFWIKYLGFCSFIYYLLSDLLMAFLQVETVFHEFGHALQHMLTKQDEGLVSGIREIEWDAVELPSQFMENWCYHR